MQKIIAIAISSIVLAGCSDKPSPAEIERALTAQLQKRCEYASITGVKVLNTQYPDAQNKNRIDVKFSGAVNVKITGPIAEARANHEKAKKVFMSYVEDVESLNKFIAQEREKIDQALKEENANYANANWARSGITPELQRESDAAYKHRDESMKLLQQKIDAQAKDVLQNTPERMPCVSRLGHARCP